MISLDQAPDGYKYFDAGVAKQIRHRSARATAQGGLRQEDFDCGEQT